MSSQMGTVIGVFNVVLIRLPGEYFSAIGGPLTAFVLLVSLPGFNRELSARCPTIAGLSTPIISTSLGSSGVRARGILALIGIGGGGGVLSLLSSRGLADSVLSLPLFGFKRVPYGLLGDALVTPRTMPFALSVVLVDGPLGMAHRS